MDVSVHSGLMLEELLKPCKHAVNDGFKKDLEISLSTADDIKDWEEGPNSEGVRGKGDIMKAALDTLNEHASIIRDSGSISVMSIICLSPTNLLYLL